MTFKPSKYQQAIYDFIEHGSGSAVIEAVAGSGKTTTIVESLKLIPPSEKILFLAFNSAIAKELQTRVPSHVRAKTFHSQGFGAFNYSSPTSVKDVEKDKTWLILDRLFEKDRNKRTEYGLFVKKLVGFAKGEGVGFLIPDEQETWRGLIEHHDLQLDSGSFDEAIKIAQFVLWVSIGVSEYGIIDFDDMIYMPLLNNCSFFRHDYVFVDEAQDTNAVQLEMIERMVKPYGRVIAVGDPHQAIYGFRGADSAAMSNIQERFQATQLPLSVSYRCPVAIVNAAKRIVPHIESAEGACQGKVHDFEDEMPELEFFEADDVILCRNTRPLVALAYKLIRSKIGCRILGKEIGKGLIALIKKMKASGVDRLEEKLKIYRDREIEKYLKDGKGDRAEALDDKIHCVLTVIKNLPETRRTVPALIEDIEQLLDDGKKNVLTLCTVHKSKGLEWNRVFILGRYKYMPSKWVKKDWQIRQEQNLIYVAYTRAKQELYFLPDNDQ